MHETERHHCRVFVVILIPEGSNVLEMHFRSKLQIDLALFSPNRLSLEPWISSKYTAVSLTRNLAMTGKRLDYAPVDSGTEVVT